MQLNTKDAQLLTLPSSPSDVSEIAFPHQKELLNHIAVDIGGSLAKVVWFTQSQTHTLKNKLNFWKIETESIQECVDFIKLLMLNDKTARVIHTTGGGAHKYYALFADQIGGLIVKSDEMECLINGLNFLTTCIPNEVFTYDERRVMPLQYEKTPTFPYLLVNIGSGVSIIKVSSESSYERISGTSLGGGTLWGLLSLLTNAESYDAMLELSTKGDNKNVDMLVGDIYGGAYNKIGLKATTIASSFGKVFKAPKEKRSEFQPEDIAVSLLYLVSNNIGQIAYLNAQAHDITKIYFSGFFINGHSVTMNTLSFAIDFWSKGRMKALFLKHEGYLGAVGAFIQDRYSYSIAK